VSASNLQATDALGKVTISGIGETGNLALGRTRNAGALLVKDAEGENAFHVNGETAGMALGRKGNAGEFRVRDSSGAQSVFINGEKGNMALGRQGNPGMLFVKDAAGDDGVIVNGGAGDVVLRGGDCAEQWEVMDPEKATPGTVMVMTDTGILDVSERAYDRLVVGIVAGGGGLRPGVVLGARPGHHRPAIALVGRVYCRVDARYGAIRRGDLLTTSDTPGHAMRVSTPARAFGAIVGKALAPFESGEGLLSVLVAVQ
jgi:hypothetical protein